MPAASLRDWVRLPLRTAGFVGVTFGMYGLLEIETALSDPAVREPVLHAWIRRYGRALLQLYGVKVHAGGAHIAGGGWYPGRDARGRGRVFVMNHRSGLDIPICLALFEATILSRADLSRWPVIGVAARRAGTLFVDRSDKRSGASATHAMVTALERGRGVLVYPEGTTFPGDEVRPFRHGAFSAAHRVGAEVVPVGIAYAGADAAYTDETFAAHMTRVSRTRSTPVAVEVGEPIASEALSVEDLGGVAHEAVQTLVHRARAALEAAAS